MFPVTSKRFASSINIPKRLVFGGLPYESTPVNVARLPDMESIEQRSTGAGIQIPSMPDSYSASNGSSFPSLQQAKIHLVAEVVPGSVSSTGSPAPH
ncbi:uncharacterized protein JCM6883_004935 [Sporobolomyces salmoneus]|uniref:uncharacterized protein n=1 Tax=Sporobolomyces salmoneus TaxID=183962 RepID=UPI0031744418